MTSYILTMLPTFRDYLLFITAALALIAIPVAMEVSKERAFKYFLAACFFGLLATMIPTSHQIKEIRCEHYKRCDP